MNISAHKTPQTQPHLLIVDDDERIRMLLRQFLIKKDFLITLARDAAHARTLLSMLIFDLVVMDIMMPGEDGIELTNYLRGDGFESPILLLTSKAEIEDKTQGFEAGADDYLTKPFEPKELLLRINAILKRMPSKDDVRVMSSDLIMGPLRYVIKSEELYHGDVQVRLTATEMQLMRIFSQSPGQPISRTKLVEQLNGNGRYAQERVIDVHITRLRQKIEHDTKKPRYLQTVRGAGYMLLPDMVDTSNA